MVSLIRTCVKSHNNCMMTPSAVFISLIWLKTRKNLFPLHFFFVCGDVINGVDAKTCSCYVKGLKCVLVDN